MTVHCYGRPGKFFGPWRNIIYILSKQVKSMEPLTLILGLSGLIETLIRDIQASGVELTPELLAKSREIREAAKAAAHAVP